MSDYTEPMETGRIESILQNMNAYNPAASKDMRRHLSGLSAELEKALGIISMLEHHWISPMEYYENVVWARMSNENIAAELSATFDLNLETTRRIADWMSG